MLCGVRLTRTGRCSGLSRSDLLLAVSVEGDHVLPEQFPGLVSGQVTGLVEVLPLFKNSKVIAALQEQAYRKPPRWAGLLRPMMLVFGG